MAKPTITKKEFKARVKEEAKRVYDQFKKDGTAWPMPHCKREVERIFKDEFEII